MTDPQARVSAAPLASVALLVAALLWSVGEARCAPRDSEKGLTPQEQCGQLGGDWSDETGCSEDLAAGQGRRGPALYQVLPGEPGHSKPGNTVTVKEVKAGPFERTATWDCDGCKILTFEGNEANPAVCMPGWACYKFKPGDQVRTLGFDEARDRMTKRRDYEEPFAHHKDEFVHGEPGGPYVAVHVVKEAPDRNRIDWSYGTSYGTTVCQQGPHPCYYYKAGDTLFLFAEGSEKRRERSRKGRED